MKRKGSLTLLAALLLVTLCGCGGGGEASSGAVSSVPTEEPEVKTAEIVMDFAGDINLDDSWYVMDALYASGGTISDAIDPALIQRMTAADLCCVNNEFSFSDRGIPMAGKAYTFRANPENVSILQTLGVDVVTLANNHVYDYGEEAFLDTLNTLKGAGIDYVGAGRDRNEAMTPAYYELDGLTIAIVNATRAEKNIMTPEADENSSGVLRCYDTALFEQVIREAKERADVVVCCVHWGTEYSYTLEEIQRSTAQTYIDAGADVIVGTHSHCLQGIEYYKGVPVFYSLGNFWFNEKELDTCLLELTVTGTKENWNLSATIVPALQSGCKTEMLADGQAVYDLLESISVNAGIREDGTVYEIQ